MSIKGVHIVRSGRADRKAWYIYAWRGGPLIRKADQPARPALTPQDLAAIADAARADCTAPMEKLYGLVAAFRKSEQWRAYSPGTQKTWGRALDAIEGKWAQVPTKLFGDPRMTPKIVAWRDGFASPRSADIAVAVLGVLLEWARLRGWVKANPASGIPTIYRREDRAPVIWLPEDRAAIARHAGQPLADALDLAALTGLRRADLVALRWDEVDDLAIRRTAAKRSRGRRYRVTLPITPDLRQLLDTLRTRPRKPGVETVLVNSYGQPWTGDGLNSSFEGARNKANDGEGIWHVERDPESGEETRLAKRIHDFRGTYVTHLMTLKTSKPLTDREIADLVGWSEQQVREIRKRYVDDRAIVVALAKRIANKPVKRTVKQSAK